MPRLTRSDLVINQLATLISMVRNGDFEPDELDAIWHRNFSLISTIPEEDPVVMP